MDTLRPELKNSPEAVWYSMRMGMFVSVGVVIIFIAGLLYFLHRQSVPMKVIVSPDNYPAGTQIEVYKDVPNEFPKDIVAAGSTLTHADIVRHADKSFVVTAVYNVAQTLPIAMSGEFTAFKAAGWQVTSSKIDTTNGYIAAAKDANTSIVATFSIDGAGSDVSFQFSGQ